SRPSEPHTERGIASGGVSGLDVASSRTRLLRSQSRTACAAQTDRLTCGIGDPRMIDTNGSDTVSRFDGLANIYDRHRPHYPDSAIDFIIREGNLGASSRAVDIGCGTGISTRQLAGRGIPVIGIEPNDEMRALAEFAPISPGLLVPQFRSGCAEATGLPD